MSFHGLPCWYELSAADTGREAAFYSAILPWVWHDAQVPGMTYMLASVGAAQVAGMMLAQPGQPAGWCLYFAVDSADETAALAQSLGATQVVPPSDIPGTGRFALLLCPQGALFGILQPLPGGTGGAFDQQLEGHGNWHELVTRDHAAAMEFYGALFGWTISRTVPMGPGLDYHILARETLDFGGIFATPSNPTFWKPYFATASANGAMARVRAAGGQILHGPDQVTPGAFTLQASDPGGSLFALVGPA